MHLFTCTVPSAIQLIQNENITEGGNVNLSCSASGTPHPIVSWLKVDSRVRFNRSELVFTNINRNEAGQYRCEASNECGNASETTTIEVQCKLSTVLILCPCNLPALTINFSLCNICYELVQQQKMPIN